VVDGGDQEWLAARLSVERIVELEFRCVAGAEVIELLAESAWPRGLDRGLGTEGFSNSFCTPGPHPR